MAPHRASAFWNSHLQARSLVSFAIVGAVTAVWLLVLSWRWPYLDQIPLFDADVTTAFTSQVLHNWWVENPVKIWFATPFYSSSVETPLLSERVLYQSWPPGAYIPIYLVGLLLGVEPTVPMINWFNAVSHGLIGIAVAFTAFNIAKIGRFTESTSAFIAVAAALSVLVEPSLGYIFSQIYCVTTAVLLYVAFFIMLEAQSFTVTEPRTRSRILALQLLIIYPAFLVDWLAYTLFAFWLVLRLLAIRFGFQARWSLRQWAGLLAMPVSAFGLYLIWRLFTPGSLAQRMGIFASLKELAGKVAFRMNVDTDLLSFGASDYPLTFRSFLSIFAEMHSNSFFAGSLFVILGLALASGFFLLVAHRASKSCDDRYRIFAIGALLGIVLVPLYLHMIVLYQHTSIHRWAISKALFAYSLIPIALFPASIALAASAHRLKVPSIKIDNRILVAVAVIAFLSLTYASEFSRASPRFQSRYLEGRIDRDNYLFWRQVGEHVGYRDVVFTPIKAGSWVTKNSVSKKLIHMAEDFQAVDRAVRKICGDFNVVVILDRGAALGRFSEKTPSEIVDTKRFRLLRFSDYAGLRTGCH